jgi:two-component system response regulator
VNASRARLLLVEDDEDDVAFFRHALGREGASVDLLVARDGDEALARLRGPDPRPTHVVLDLKLPRLSGLEVLEALRRDPASAVLPVAVLTSSQEPADVAKARELGVDGYHIKPAGLEGLRRVVREIRGTWKL